MIVSFVVDFVLRYVSLLALVVIMHEAGHLLACRALGISAELRYVHGDGFVVFSEALVRKDHVPVIIAGVLAGVVPFGLAFIAYLHSFFDWVILFLLFALYWIVWIRYDLRVLKGLLRG